MTISACSINSLFEDVNWVLGKFNACKSFIVRFEPIICTFSSFFRIPFNKEKPRFPQPTIPIVISLFLTKVLFSTFLKGFSVLIICYFRVQSKLSMKQILFVLLLLSSTYSFSHDYFFAFAEVEYDEYNE